MGRSTDKPVILALLVVPFSKTSPTMLELKLRAELRPKGSKSVSPKSMSARIEKNFGVEPSQNLMFRKCVSFVTNQGFTEELPNPPPKLLEPQVDAWVPEIGMKNDVIKTSRPRKLISLFFML
jgi:hypothetical protein